MAAGGSDACRARVADRISLLDGEGTRARLETFLERGDLHRAARADQRRPRRFAGTAPGRPAHPGSNAFGAHLPDKYSGGPAAKFAERIAGRYSSLWMRGRCQSDEYLQAIRSANLAAGPPEYLSGR